MSASPTRCIGVHGLLHDPHCVRWNPKSSSPMGTTASHQQRAVSADAHARHQVLVDAQRLHQPQLPAADLEQLAAAVPHRGSPRGSATAGFCRPNKRMQSTTLRARKTNGDRSLDVHGVTKRGVGGRNRTTLGLILLTPTP